MKVSEFGDKVVEYIAGTLAPSLPTMQKGIAMGVAAVMKIRPDVVATVLSATPLAMLGVYDASTGEVDETVVNTFIDGYFGAVDRFEIDFGSGKLALTKKDADAFAGLFKQGEQK